MLFWCALGICLRETRFTERMKIRESVAAFRIFFLAFFAAAAIRLPSAGEFFVCVKKKFKWNAWVCLVRVWRLTFSYTYYASSTIKPGDYGDCRCIVSIFIFFFIASEFHYSFSRCVNHNLFSAKRAHSAAPSFDSKSNFRNWRKNGNACIEFWI